MIVLGVWYWCVPSVYIIGVNSGSMMLVYVIAVYAHGDACKVSYDCMFLVYAVVA